MGMFYADDILVGSRDPECLQGTPNVLIGLFQWYGLVANITKFKAMTCQSGAIWSGMSEKVVGWWITGKGSAYKYMLRRRILCSYVRGEITGGSIAAHQRRMHGRSQRSTGTG